MKKFYILLLTLTPFYLLQAQKAIVINGGQFGNQNENVNVMIYDPVTNSHLVMDTIHTQSVQDMLLDSIYAYVAAQDSLVKYNMVTGRRMASAKFAGVSTKVMHLTDSELWVGNWYAQTQNNLYVYDANTLQLVDSVPAASKGVTSLVQVGSSFFVPQNTSTAAPNYQDTLGYIIEVDINSRAVVDTLTVSGYTGDIGEIFLSSLGTNLVTINSISNSFTNIPLGTMQPVNIPTGLNLQVSSRQQYFLRDDTLFLRMNNGLGVIDMTTQTVLDTTLIDTVVTAFDYDTAYQRFIITQTDFFSYNKGAIHNRNGSKISSYFVGFSPEVISMYYSSQIFTQLIETEQSLTSWEIYPNPVQDQFRLQTDYADGQPIFLRVFNSKGQQLLHVPYRNGQSVNVSDLPGGMYVLSLQADQGQSVKKLIIR
jgi:hypothetical protein